VQHIISQSAHPLSRYISRKLGKPHSTVKLDSYEEITGKGIEARHKGQVYRIGSSEFAGDTVNNPHALFSEVYVNIRGESMGKFTVDKAYHNEHIFSQKEGLYFNQSPHEKKAFLGRLGKSGRRTAMIGDGLNDAGALMNSYCGISVAEDLFQFAPASDAILLSDSIMKLDAFFAYSKATLKVVKWSFILSFIYNAIGIFFAVQGLLSPVIAAILMPLSSITVVAFVSLGTWHHYRRIILKQKTDKSQYFE
jgi:Cu+-exporting ATPase